MALTRRGVLAGGSAAVLALAILGRAPRAAPVREVPFAVPEDREVDLVEHVLSRCSFGAAPGDRERLRALATRTEDAVDRWVDDQLQASGEEDPGPALSSRTEERLDCSRAAHLLAPVCGWIPNCRASKSLPPL